jgi:hypothetical protein
MKEGYRLSSQRFRLAIEVLVWLYTCFDGYFLS